MNIAVMHEPRRMNPIKLGTVFLIAAFVFVLLMLAVAFMAKR